MILFCVRRDGSKLKLWRTSQCLVSHPLLNRRYYNASKDALGVQFELDSNGQIVTDDDLQTNFAGIYAVGDVVSDHEPLTPVAIRNARAVIRRIAASTQSAAEVGNTAIVGLRGSGLVPTTVFTPVEYGCVGLSEEDAIAQYGDDRIESFLWQWTSLEAQASTYAPFPSPSRSQLFSGSTLDTQVSRVASKQSPSGSQFAHPGHMREGDEHPQTCFAKLVCDTANDNRVLGFHFVGPNAGEVTQGFSLVGDNRVLQEVTVRVFTLCVT